MTNITPGLSQSLQGTQEQEYSALSPTLKLPVQRTMARQGTAEVIHTPGTHLQGNMIKLEAMWLMMQASFRVIWGTRFSTTVESVKSVISHIIPLDSESLHVTKSVRRKVGRSNQVVVYYHGTS